MDNDQTFFFSHKYHHNLSLGPDLSTPKPFLLFQNLSAVFNFSLFSVMRKPSEITPYDLLNCLCLQQIEWR